MGIEELLFSDKEFIFIGTAKEIEKLKKKVYKIDPVYKKYIDSLDKNERKEYPVNSGEYK